MAQAPSSSAFNTQLMDEYAASQAQLSQQESAFSSQQASANAAASPSARGSPQNRLIQRTNGTRVPFAQSEQPRNNAHPQELQEQLQHEQLNKSLQGKEIELPPTPRTALAAAAETKYGNKFLTFAISLYYN